MVDAVRGMVYAWLTKPERVVSNLAIRIHIGSVTIEVDNEDDLRTALAVVGASVTPAPKSLNGASAKQTGEPFSDLWSSLPANQRKLIRTVFAGGSEGATDVDLRAALNQKTNNGLAGVVSGLAKNAKRFDLQLTDIILREKRKSDDGRRVSLFHIVPAAAAKMPLIGGRGRPRKVSQ